MRKMLIEIAVVQLFGNDTFGIQKMQLLILKNRILINETAIITFYNSKSYIFSSVPRMGDEVFVIVTAGREFPNYPVIILGTNSTIDLALKICINRERHQLFFQ